MTAATAVRSAYPPAIADLMPQAIELTKTLDGDLPSRNKLMKDLHIGSDKAKAILAELAGPSDADQRVSQLTDELLAIRQKYADRGADLPSVNAEAVRESVARLVDRADHTVAETTPVSAPPVDTEPAPAIEPEPVAEPIPELSAPVAAVATPAARKPVTWPVFILCLPAFVAIWGGWVAMGQMTGFGMVTLLPGFSDFQINTAITLPIGVETYAAYALFAWLSGHASEGARKFAKVSALTSLGIGALGQIAYHLMAAAGWQHAPWLITAIVACIPVAVLGMGAT
jgi:hypothetical protein